MYHPLFPTYCFLLFVLVLPTVSAAQSLPIPLSEAFEIAEANYPQLEQDRLAVEQRRILLKTASRPADLDIYLSGMQVDPERLEEGIHGAGFEQRFNWPSGKKYRSAALEEQLRLSNAQLELTAFELRQQVALAYYEMLYAKELRSFCQEQRNLMDELLELAQAKLNLGETSKVPVLSARSKQRQAALEQQRAQDAYDLAYTLFNNWLFADTAYVAMGVGLPAPQPYLDWFVNGGHPQLLLAEQEIRLAAAQIQSERAYRLPKIIAGAQVQMINGDLPFIAYTLGMSVPLGQESIKARVESAEVGVAREQAQLQAAEENLERKRRELIARLKKEQSALSFLQEEILPFTKEQIMASRKAYTQGTVAYQDYLLNLEEALGSRRDYIETLRRYHILRLKLEFLSGKR